MRTVVVDPTKPPRSRANSSATATARTVDTGDVLVPQKGTLADGQANATALRGRRVLDKTGGMPGPLAFVACISSDLTYLTSSGGSYFAG
jgi:hypothetical protein